MQETPLRDVEMATEASAVRGSGGCGKVALDRCDSGSSRSALSADREMDEMNGRGLRKGRLCRERLRRRLIEVCLAAVQLLSPIRLPQECTASGNHPPAKQETFRDCWHLKGA